MKQKDSKKSEQIITAVNVYTKNSPNNRVNELFADENESMRDNDPIKKAEELFAPYYDEFHFANYE